MKFKNIFIILFVLFVSIQNVFAEQASVKFEVLLPSFLKIETVTSPVLNAHIVDKTGNMYAPLSCKFRVISNSSETKTLYLKSTSITKNGAEESMFNVGGQAYIAFTNIQNIPNSESLINCKMNAPAKLSPGVVAYPITSIIGTKHKYNRGKGKFEVYVENGETNVAVNIGMHVLKNSFDERDPYGFYQATLSLTEADI